MSKEIIPVLIKYVVFKHVGQSIMDDKTKEKIEFSDDGNFLIDVKMEHGIIQKFGTTWMALYLNISL